MNTKACKQTRLTTACRTFTIDRMPVFFKQRDNLFFPAWAFVIPSTLVRFPISFVESLFWTVFTYFEIPLTLDAGRFGSVHLATEADPWLALDPRL